MSDVDCLAIAVTADNGGTRIHLRGELDLSGVPALNEQFKQVCDGACSTVVIDVSELTYCDSSGIHALLQAASRCAQDGRNMQVAGAHGIVRRVIHITHTAGAFTFVEDHANAEA